jgi:hypothetical protein
MAQDSLDDCDLVDEGDEAHLVLEMRAQWRVSFPGFLDEFAPLLGGDPAKRVIKSRIATSYHPHIFASSFTRPRPSRETSLN